MTARHRNSIVRWVTLALAMALVSPAAAQRVGAQLGAEQTIVGVPVTLTVRVADVARLDPPKLPPIDGATIAFASEGSQTSSRLINGRLTSSTTYSFSYTLTPTREGVVRVPSLDIEIDGAVFPTQPLLLRVTPPQSSDATRLDLIVSNDEPYVGEPFTIRFRWAFPRRIMRAARSIGPVELPDSIRVLQAVDPRPVGAQRSNRNFERLDGLFGTPLYATTDVVTRAREQFIVLEATVLAAATEAGEISIGPASVLYDEILGGRLRTESAIREARSEPVIINPRALPTEGVPPGFNGLVGRVQLETEVDRDDIGVGDPITLRLRVTGDEPLARFDPPDLGAAESFGAFRTDTEGWSTEASRNGERIYETLIRASNDEVESVPEIRTPYFDTELGEYRIASSEAIPISVRTRRRVTAADAEIAPQTQAPTPTLATTPLERANVGPPATPLTEDLLVDRSFTLGTALRHPASIAVLAGGPLSVLAACALAAHRSRRDPREQRRQHALKRARRAIGGSIDSSADAVRGFIADHAHLPQHSVTGEDVRTIRGDRADLDILRRVLDAHDASRFGSGGASSPSPNEIKAALRRAHQQNLRGARP